MKPDRYYFQFQSWHFIIGIIAFYFLTVLVSEVKIKAMPVSDGEKSLSSFNEDFNSGDFSFIFFYDGNSELCRKMKYNVEQLAENNKENIHFFEVDLNSSPQLYAKYNISGVPNLLIVKENRELARVMGIVSSDNLNIIYSRILNKMNHL